VSCCCISIPDPGELIDDAVSTVGEAVTDAEELASAAVNNFETSMNWAWEHKGTVAAVTAAGVCVAASAGICAGVSVVALGAATMENAENCSSVSKFIGAEGISVGTTIVGGAPGIIKAGVEVATGARAAEGGLGAAGTAAVNAPNSAVAAATGGVIDPRAHEVLGSC